MVGLPHLDVSHQVAPRAGVQQVGHGDHQVKEAGPVLLLCGAQLGGDTEAARYRREPQTPFFSKSLSRLEDREKPLCLDGFGNDQEHICQSIKSWFENLPPAC